MLGVTDAAQVLCGCQSLDLRRSVSSCFALLGLPEALIHKRRNAVVAPSQAVFLARPENGTFAS